MNLSLYSGRGGYEDFDAFFRDFFGRMSDAGDEIQVEAAAVEVEATTAEAPKGKMSLEDALQVCLRTVYDVNEKCSIMLSTIHSKS